MNTPRVGRSRAAQLARIQFHSDGCGREQHPAIDVKVQSLPDNGMSEEDARGAWEGLVEQWWEQAIGIAHQHGYACVFSEGRSGGWCVPFYQGGRKFQSWPGQGGAMGYPTYPDVVNDATERRRFLAFQKDILALLADVPYQWKQMGSKAVV